MLARLGRDRARARSGRGGDSFCFVAAQSARRTRCSRASERGSNNAPRAGSVFRFPAAYLAAVRYTTDRTYSRDRVENGAWLRLLCRDPGPSIMLASRVNSASPLKSSKPFVRGPDAVRRADPPIGRRTDLEKQLADMWASLLGLPAVGIHDNFFDLGGHSLLAVQLLSLVRQTFDVELSLKVVYSSDFTVAELAKAIELREIEGAGSDQYAAVLKELEGLTEDEVRDCSPRSRMAPAGASEPCAFC